MPIIGGALSKPIVGRGAAYADYDKNGTLDIMVTENGGPVHLFRNDSDVHNFLRVNVKSISSNRDGLSTKLIGITKNNRMQRRVKTGSSFMSHSETTITFGLGNDEVLDSLYVYWPNGSMETFHNIYSGQEINIIEGQGNWVVQ